MLYEYLGKIKLTVYTSSSTQVVFEDRTNFFNTSQLSLNLQKTELRKILT